jgi:hypothetical protein
MRARADAKHATWCPIYSGAFARSTRATSNSQNAMRCPRTCRDKYPRRAFSGGPSCPRQGRGVWQPLQQGTDRCAPMPLRLYSKQLPRQCGFMRNAPWSLLVAPTRSSRSARSTKRTGTEPFQWPARAPPAHVMSTWREKPQARRWIKIQQRPAVNAGRPGEGLRFNADPESLTSMTNPLGHAQPTRRASLSQKSRQSFTRNPVS